MCGIVGVFGKINENEISTMMDLVKHRGPDGEGLFTSAKVALGHTRLSIIDVNTGSQPISNEDDTIQIVANGEIYNYKELQNELGDHLFKTHSDTEVILHLYEEIGLEVFSKLDGMFTIAIHDNGDLNLARDPLGIKGLYYANQGGSFHFASEVKALLPFCSEIKEFPNGHYYHSRYGFTQYYKIPDSVDYSGKQQELITNLYDEFDRCVKKRLMSDVPLGVFLSGGLDSSLTSAFAKKYKDDLHSFSVGTLDSPDRSYAHQVASFLGTNHHEYILDVDEMYAAIPDIIYHLESFDAALVRSAIPNYFLCKMTKEYVSVVLSGEGADELFAGYAYLEDLSEDVKLHEELIYITENLHNTNLQRVDRMTMAHGLEGRVPFLDKKMLELAFSMPVTFKIDRENSIEKWILKETFKKELPASIINRKKEKFSTGCGSTQIMKDKIEQSVSDGDFSKEKILENGYVLNSKEEFFYYRIFNELFNGKISIDLVGKSRSL